MIYYVGVLESLKQLLELANNPKKRKNIGEKQQDEQEEQDDNNKHSNKIQTLKKQKVEKRISEELQDKIRRWIKDRTGKQIRFYEQDFSWYKSYCSDYEDDSRFMKDRWIVRTDILWKDFCHFIGGKDSKGRNDFTRTIRTWFPNPSGYPDRRGFPGEKNISIMYLPFKSNLYDFDWETKAEKRRRLEKREEEEKGEEESEEDMIGSD